jgi:hypothetical protein
LGCVPLRFLIRLNYLLKKIKIKLFRNFTSLNTPPWDIG